MAYEKELDAAKKAASLAARLCQVLVLLLCLSSELLKFDSFAEPIF